MVGCDFVNFAEKIQNWHDSGTCYKNLSTFCDGCYCQQWLCIAYLVALLNIFSFDYEQLEVEYILLVLVKDSLMSEL